MKSTDLNIYRFLRKMVKILPIHTIYYLFFQGIIALIPAIQSMAIASFIDNLSYSENYMSSFYNITFPIVVILICVFFQNTIPIVTGIVNTSKSNILTIYFSNLLLNKQMKLSYKYIEDESVNDIIYRIRDKCVRYFDEGYSNLISSATLGVKLLSLLFIIFRANFISGCVIIVIAYPLLYFALKTGKKNYDLEQNAEKIKRKYQYIFSILTNKEFVNERNLYGFSDGLTKTYNKLFDIALDKERKIISKRYANMKSGSIVTLIVSIGIMAIMLPSVFDKEITVGLYIGLSGAVLDLVQGMSWQLAGMMQNYAKLNGFLKDFNIFMKLDEQSGAASLPKPIATTSQLSIDFKNVNFRYPGTQKYILKNCTFSLTEGKSYAIVGENGAGKTTITKLLIGLYDDYEGEILINNRNIRDYSNDELKYLIGTAFQDFSQYGLTVEENIGIGDIIDYSREKSQKKDIKEICKILNMTNWISSLPEAFNTQVGKIEENGINLSGGQWQKIAVARLLYKNADINILDEPTSAMDAIAESEFYKLFQTLNIGKLNIIITHRLGAAKTADEILVIQNGCVIEQGNHNTLIKNEGGVYRKMYESQRKWYE